MKAASAFVAALFASAVVVCAQPAAPADRPNIVIVLADDLGSHDVGWRGGKAKTPHLDALAADGATLESFYVLPVCSPTRAALLTGRYPFRYGLQTAVVKPWASYGLPLDERTLPQALRDAGYETAIVGKWHLGHARPEYLPTARGFEHQYGHYNGALDYFTHIRDGGHDWHRDGKRSDDQGYSTTLLGDEAVRLINERDKRRPLFLYVPFQAVHGPLQVPAEYETAYADVKRPRRKTYLGMITAMDEQIGRIRAALRANGMEANTLILFSSDNGGPDPATLTSNGPLRAGKGTLYEGGIRVSALATWPGVIPPRSSVTTPMHIVDWYATSLAIGNASAEQPKAIDGQNVLPVLKGDANALKREELILNVAPRTGAIRRGDWKLVISGNRRVSEGDNEQPTTDEARPGKVELFNLAVDIGEQHDVSAEHPDRVRSMRERYETLLKDAPQPFDDAPVEGFKSPPVWGEFTATTRPAAK